MKAPGFAEHPEHKVETERLQQRVEIFLDNDCILESQGAIKVTESHYEDRIYVPINDLTHIDLIKTGEYYCPFKGHAELYDVKHGERTIKNAAWSYVEPFDEVQELMGRVAFYSEKVQEIRVN
jgi:uncharacterized protein (DUF427 family)